MYACSKQLFVCFFHPYSNSMQMALLLSPFCRWENWVLGALNNLWKFKCSAWTQLVWPVHQAIPGLFNTYGKDGFLLRVLEIGDEEAGWERPRACPNSLALKVKMQSSEPGSCMWPVKLQSSTLSPWPWLGVSLGVKWRDRSQREGLCLLFPNHMIKKQSMVFF